MGYRMNSIQGRNAGVNTAPGFGRVNVAPAGEQGTIGSAAYAVKDENMSAVKSTYRDMRQGTNASGNNKFGAKMDKYNARNAALSYAGGDSKMMLQDASGNRAPGLSGYFPNK